MGEVSTTCSEYQGLEMLGTNSGSLDQYLPLSPHAEYAPRELEAWEEIQFFFFQLTLKISRCQLKSFFLN
jgi:hypothetical protein